ncbi:hypothetical protein LARI1_G008111 [Lachnellula arida]|uniref:Uncharacterized protein n=1 Tax=Lachnellula arida TaxID=1316785 RepID=A0A8T9B5K3_9HELO|nr:hypothetical protein LARI1_G008111 [Lachnellula arida]
MIPEGLGLQSIQNIVSKLSETGFNAVRLTFAIETVDDILDNGGDVTLSDTLTEKQTGHHSPASVSATSSPPNNRSPNHRTLHLSHVETHMTKSASTIHAINPDVLIYFSGLDSDFNIEPAVGSAAQDPSFSFDAADYEWSDEFGFEMREYDESFGLLCCL